MNAAEYSILDFFGRYLVRPSEMLFCCPNDCRITDKRFHSAMLRLVEKGLVIKERPRQAYSLTEAGYRLARSRRPKQSDICPADYCRAVVPHAK